MSEALLQEKGPIKINILGTMYTIIFKKLNNCDGYCDKTTKEIVITVIDADWYLKNPEAYQRKVIRHEVVHAFLYESGLAECWNHKSGHDEVYVDWIACQLPKINATLIKAGLSKCVYGRNNEKCSYENEGGEA